MLTKRKNRNIKNTQLNPEKAEKGWKMKKETKNKDHDQKNVASMVGINPTISIITLNVNGINTPMKIHRLSECIIKQDLIIYYLQETNFKYKETYRLKKGWRMIYHANINQKQS